MFTTIYHPAAWLSNWPKDAKPYASVELVLAYHPELKAEDVQESAFMDPTGTGVVTTKPAPVIPMEQAAAQGAPFDESLPASEAVVPAPSNKKPTVKKSAVSK